MGWILFFSRAFFKAPKGVRGGSKYSSKSKSTFFNGAADGRALPVRSTCPFAFSWLQTRRRFVCTVEGRWGWLNEDVDLRFLRGTVTGDLCAQRMEKPATEWPEGGVPACSSLCDGKLAGELHALGGRNGRLNGGVLPARLSFLCDKPDGD